MYRCVNKEQCRAAAHLAAGLVSEHLVGELEGVSEGGGGGAP